MARDLDSKLGAALDRFTGKRAAGPDRGPKADQDPFPAEFAIAKRVVIRPVFEQIGNALKERGHEFNISEEPNGKISIHIVPAGVKRSVHPDDLFPTFSFYPSPHTRMIGMHARNMLPNAGGLSGARGAYKPAQVDRQFVEDALMKFIGEIRNW